MSQMVSANNPWKIAVLAGMASYLDAATLIITGLAIGSLYADSMNLSDGTIGLLLGLQGLMFAVGALFGGRLGDRFGRRRVFTYSLATLAAGVTVLAVATNPWMLTLGVIVSGVAIGADLPVSLAMINEEAPAGKKGKMVAFTELLWGAGIGVAGILGGIVGGMEATGARILYGHIVVVALIVLALRMSTRESMEWTAAREAVDDSSTDTGVRFSQVGQLFRKPVLAPVLATGLYYALWGAAGNTIGAFGPYIWENIADGKVATWSLISVAGLPLAGLGALWFLRVVDTPARQRWVRIGTVLTVVAWVFPVVLGPTKPALVLTSVLFVVGTAFAGETIYKVWSQELVPTLLRGTAQGVTMAGSRVFVAAFGAVTPWMVRNHTDLHFGLILVLIALSAYVGLRWVSRLPTATELETPVLIVGDSTGLVSGRP